MIIRLTIAVLSSMLVLSSMSAFADSTKSCSMMQQSRCASFCRNHLQAKSCIIDMTTQIGTCTCGDGTTHSKTK